MTHQIRVKNYNVDQFVSSSLPLVDPREKMMQILPGFCQPFLTWLTAKPPVGDHVRERSPLFFVRVALAQTIGGVALAALALIFWAEAPVPIAAMVLFAGLVLSTSGLGLFQVVIFHHCSHGTVFQDRDMNVTVGRLISAILLFKHFDAYKVGHMVHHSNNKLLTEEDEFADFVFGMCGLRPGMSKAVLWRRVLVALASPIFHVNFLRRRLRGAWASPDRTHNVIGASVWAGLAIVAFVAGQFDVFLLAWVLPVTVLLQIATVFRILCEHRFPDPEVIRQRGRDFACHATAGVFPGVMPPRRLATSPLGALHWAGWWIDMLTVQILVRLIVLVGDAPCHDYHHRRPASRRWTSYIQARQVDVETNASGFTTGYQETWGLFRALDQNLDSLARTSPDFLAGGAA